ncbi:hypothetical protein GLAREA_04340 [Glarea lozoyensis ATCC 20868]|uniref:Uncharacterized protein n=1 Tax=Glarea lozoyensis (strain ATCC 20868 / MF5171) TaxID=1116229 RepID=S3CR08_GLAL2|nr:uncharacterized protein GLAREA_04340 [Glarea lozoyensis ATCC 20868]EPE27549.1 hypothetical protein GLAREA_04340 [Glarea lozoyensis ATCC 20868]
MSSGSSSSADDLAKEHQSPDKEDSPLLKSTNSHIFLACITCERIVMLTGPRQEIVHEGDSVSNLFAPTIGASCEPDDDSKSWSRISINKVLITLWGPYLAISAFIDSSLHENLKLDESHDRTKVRLSGRAYAAQLLDGDVEVCSVLTNPTDRVRLQVLPYVESEFFHLE